MFPRRAVAFFLLVMGIFVVSQVYALHQGVGWELETFDSKPENLEIIRGLLEATPKKYDDFFSALGLVKSQDRKIKIKLFPNKDAYKDYQQKNSQSKSDHAYFSLFNSEVVTWNTPNQEDLVSNLLHELTHDRVRNYISDERIPRCIDEGLAEVFEVAQVSGTSITVGGTSLVWKDLLKKALAASEVKPFGYFLEMNPREFTSYKHANLSHLEIAQCWAQSHFLYYSHAGEFRPFLRLMMEEGTTPRSVPDLYKKAKIAMAYSEMEERWLDFIKQL